mgnify:CR=1 FL=1
MLMKMHFRFLEVKEAKATESIADARILVVAGRGVRKKEDLSMLEELAVLLGGRLASSRALVEKGWMPAKCQIGLSGNTVSPQYIITCGVSGTVQFMAGMKHARISSRSIRIRMREYSRLPLSCTWRSV